MDPARWHRLEQICFDAFEQTPPERSAFLAAACGDDDALREDAQALLERLTAHPDFLERPVADLRTLAPEPDLTGTETIGPYRLLRLLGRGGMGSVYLAERHTEDIRQSVALKVIRRGMDTDEVLGRFRLERRILASLHHPNIAQLIDAAATDDGRPYFVMEFVDGTPLTTYCEQQGLALDERLRLFQAICGAVQHAHQNLIVHRDLKPRNILVTADGIPTLLDFGIGKVLGSGDGYGPHVETRTDVRLLTPEYASPEQVAGSPVTTATDVYGLGLLLYELLTGKHPYLAGGESLADIERAVLNSAPTRPSLAPGHPGSGERRRLAGDLDTIVLKALRKEPERRYPSAAALADDVRRHLAGLPVSARPDTFGYRTRKFVRRNAAAVAIGTTLFLALGATAITTTVQSGRVAAEAIRVRRERDKALEVRGFLLEMFGANGANQAVRDSVTARQLLDLQAGRLDDAYPDRPELKADMMEVLAEGYDRLGLYPEAEDLARRSLTLREAILEPPHPEIAASMGLLGWIIHERGRSDQAEPVLRDAAAMGRLAGPDSRPRLSRTLNDLGVLYNATNRYAAAESTLTEALAIRREFADPDHRAIGITANNLAAAYYYQGRTEEAIPIQRLAVQSLQASVGPDHQRTIVALGNLAVFNQIAGNWAGAEPEYRELLARQARLQGRDHPVTAHVMLSLATTLAARDDATGEDARLAEADSLATEALGVLEARLGPAHPQLAAVLDQRSGIRLAHGTPDLALADADRALTISVAGGGRPANVAAAKTRKASILWRTGARSRALVLQREAVTLYAATVGPDHLQTARAEGGLCEMLVGGDGDGDALEAERLCGRAERILAAGPRGYHAGLPLLRVQRAAALLRLGRVAEADSLLVAAGDAIGRGAGGRQARHLFDSLRARRSGGR